MVVVVIMIMNTRVQVLDLLEDGCEGLLKTLS